MKHLLNGKLQVFWLFYLNFSFFVLNFFAMANTYSPLLLLVNVTTRFSIFSISNIQFPCFLFIADQNNYFSFIIFLIFLSNINGLGKSKKSRMCYASIGELYKRLIAEIYWQWNAYAIAIVNLPVSRFSISWNSAADSKCCWLGNSCLLFVAPVSIWRKITLALGVGCV